MNISEGKPSHEQCIAAFLSAKSPSEGVEAVRRLCILSRPSEDVSPKEPSPEEFMYAIGACHTRDDCAAFWYGPSRFVHDMLTMSGQDANSAVFRLSRDGSQSIVARWNPTANRWDLTE